MGRKTYKKLLIIIILTIILLTLSLFGIRNYNYSKLEQNSKKINENQKLFRVKFLVMKKTNDNYSLKDSLTKHFDDFLSFADSYIEVKKDGNYYVATLNNNVNEEILKYETDYAFAKNNNFAQMIDDITYNKKTKEIKIPKKYYKDDLQPAQMEFLVRMTEEEARKLSINVKQENLFSSNKKMHKNIIDNFIETNVTIKKGYNKKNLKVLINNNKYLVRNDEFSYDKNSRKLTLEISPILVDNIRVVNDNKLSRFLSINKVSASATLMGKPKKGKTIHISEIPKNDEGTITLGVSRAVDSDKKAYKVYSFGKSVPTENGKIDWENVNEADFTSAKYDNIITFSKSDLESFNAAEDEDGFSLTSSCAHITVAWKDINAGAVKDNYPFVYKIKSNSTKTSGVIYFAMDPKQKVWTGTGSPDVGQTLLTYIKFKVDNTKGNLVWTKNLDDCDNYGVPLSGWIFDVYSAKAKDDGTLNMGNPQTQIQSLGDGEIIYPQPGSKQTVDMNAWYKISERVDANNCAISNVQTGDGSWAAYTLSTGGCVKRIRKLCGGERVTNKNTTKCSICQPKANKTVYCDNDDKNIKNRCPANYYGVCIPKSWYGTGDHSSFAATFEFWQEGTGNFIVPEGGLIDATGDPDTFRILKADQPGTCIVGLPNGNAVYYDEHSNIPNYTFDDPVENDVKVAYNQIGETCWKNYNANIAVLPTLLFEHYDSNAESYYYDTWLDYAKYPGTTTLIKDDAHFRSLTVDASLWGAKNEELSYCVPVVKKDKASHKRLCASNADKGCLYKEAKSPIDIIKSESNNKDKDFINKIFNVKTTSDNNNPSSTKDEEDIIDTLNQMANDDNSNYKKSNDFKSDINRYVGQECNFTLNNISKYSSAGNSLKYRAGHVVSSDCPDDYSIPNILHKLHNYYNEYLRKLDSDKSSSGNNNNNDKNKDYNNKGQSNESTSQSDSNLKKFIFALRAYNSRYEGDSRRTKDLSKYDLSASFHIEADENGLNYVRDITTDDHSGYAFANNLNKKCEPNTPTPTYTITETRAPKGWALSKPNVIKNYSGHLNNGYDNCIIDNEFENPRLKLNWIKVSDYNDSSSELKSVYTDLHTTKLNGAEFKVAKLNDKDSNVIDGYLVVDPGEKEAITDDNNVTKKCYIVDNFDEKDIKNASTLVSSNVSADNTPENGEVCVVGAPEGKYKIIETLPAQYHSFGDKDTIKQKATENYHPIILTDNVTQGDEKRNAFYNCPTEYEFTKSVSDDTSEDADQVEETTEELQDLYFNVKGQVDKYKDKLILVYDMDEPLKDPNDTEGEYNKKRVYEYAGYEDADHNNRVIEREKASDGKPHEITSILRLNKDRKYRIKFMPWIDSDEGNKFTTSETENTDKTDAAGLKCFNGGFYMPNDMPLIAVKPTSGTCKVDIEKGGGAAVNALNNPTTVVNFDKKDFYDNYTKDTLSEKEDKKLFDTIDFALHFKDENGKVIDDDVCLQEISPGLYRYNTSKKKRECTSVLHTNDGHITIKHLCSDRNYQIEEKSQPNTGTFALEPDHPKVDFSVSKTEEEAKVNKDAETKIVYNKPTEIRFQKRDLKYGYVINDTDVREHYENLKHLATFQLRRCEDIALDKCTKENSKLIKLEQRRTIGTSEHPDEEDYGKLVYIYPDTKFIDKTTVKVSDDLVEDLHLYKGDLVIRYLPSGYYEKNEDGSNGTYHEYSYFLEETKAPAGYDLPTNGNEITRFNVPKDTLDVNVIEIPNKPTKVIVEKYDMTSGRRLRGSKFKLYRVPNDKDGHSHYDPNKSLLNQDMEELKLHTVRDGEYEFRYNPDVLDTKEFTTCYDNCNDITEDLYKRFSGGRFEDTKLADEEKQIEILQGQAIIQYLEVNTYYIIEEVKAPDGYELSKKKEDRYKLVYLPASDDNVVTQFEQPNPENYFQFYKFDEYNNLLDGAKFKLQKLDDNKKYHDVNVEYDEERSNNLKVPVYRMIDVTKDIEVLDDKTKEEEKKEETEENKDSTENKEEVKEEDKNIITTLNGTATIFRLAEGQYRVLEVEAAPGKELPKKTINVATFFVDSDGHIYGNSIITNKKPTVPNIVKPSASAELQIDVRTGKLRVRYSLIIISIIFVIGLLIYIINKKETK